jgi:hypothetical protein
MAVDPKTTAGVSASTPKDDPKAAGTATTPKRDAPLAGKNVDEPDYPVRQDGESDEDYNARLEEAGFAPLSSVQTTYPTSLRPGVAGAIVNEEPTRLISRTIEDAAGVGFGIGVIQGVNDKGCKVGAYTTEGAMLGVTVRQRNVSPNVLNGSGYAQYDSVRIMRSGVIWVEVTNAVVAGDPAKMDATGKFGKGTGTGDVPHARFDTSQSTVGGLAQLRIDG